MNLLMRTLKGTQLLNTAICRKRLFSSMKAISASNIDSQLDQFYRKSLDDSDFFDVRELVSVYSCFDANMHLGHKRDSGHDSFQQYLYGTRLDVSNRFGF